MMPRSRAQVAGKSAGRARLILVIGGAASGKSAKALVLAGRATPRIFVATGQALDREMTDRIDRHRLERGAGWETAEVPIELAKWFEKNRGRYRVVVLDCITLWLSNLQRAGVPALEIPEHVSTLIREIRQVRARVVVVTNELGMGLVPFDCDTRRFRDLAGEVNQQLAAGADEVHLSVAGLSLQMK
jgi:adenosylcobinamide kinase/adenosylcobinamide-phosphate guanylyltransferase